MHLAVQHPPCLLRRQPGGKLADQRQEPMLIFFHYATPVVINAGSEQRISIVAKNALLKYGLVLIITRKTTMSINSIESLVPKEHLDLLFRFFLVFSRFEYALKRAGFVNSSGNKVNANWDAFASKYNAAFEPAQSQALKQAYAYFRNHPPRKQIVNAGALDWSEPNAIGKEPLLIWLLGSIRIVRNNLFHGGKFPIAPIAEPARNPVLLRHALTIIDACLPLDAKVNEYFIMVEE